MDRNTFTGLFLIMIIIAGSVWFLKPSDAEIKKEKELQHRDSLKRAGIKSKKPAGFMQRAFAFRLIPAATYSPTQLPAQYHQLRRT